MSEDDAELGLIRRAAAGDALALERLLVKHRSYLVRYVGRHVPNVYRRSIDPADVVQDVYIQVFRRVGAFNASDAQSALRWFVRLSRSRLVSLIRRQRSIKRRASNADPEAAGTDFIMLCLQDLAVYERTPSRSAASHELIVTMQRLLKGLSPDHQQVLRLRFMEQLDFMEIAARMQRSERAVQHLCNRAMNSLRVELKSASPFI